MADDDPDKINGRQPEDSEIAVFRYFVAKLMSLRKQLYDSYHGDQYLRDRLLTAMYMPHIIESLRDRVPCTSEQFINRVANRLSSHPKTAGSVFANCNTRYYNREDEWADITENKIMTM